METVDVDLFAVQPFMQVADYLTIDAFQAHMTALCRTIAARRERGDSGAYLRPALVVFPEDLCTFLSLEGRGALVAKCTTGNQAMQAVGRAILPRVAAQMARHTTRSLTNALFLALAPQVHRFIYATFSGLARRYDLWIVAGSALLPRNALGDDTPRFRAKSNDIYNTSYTFDPSGRCVNVVRKVNLVPTQEDVLGLAPGAAKDLRPFETPFGRVGNAICYDGFRVAHTPNEPRFVPAALMYDRLGVDIITQPSANPWFWDERWVFGKPGDTLMRREQWLNEGLAASMAETPHVRYGVNAQLIARIFDYHFDGRSYIFERTPSGDVHVVAQAGHTAIAPESEEIVMATVSLPSRSVVNTAAARPS